VSTDWAALALAILFAAVLTFVPGALALRGLGVRGLPLAAFSAIASVAMLGVAAIILGLIGVGWSVLSLSAVFVVVVLLAWLVGSLLRMRDKTGDSPSAPAERRLLWAATAAGVALTTWRLLSYVQDPAGISQTNDAVFHMNAIRYVLDTADASSLHVSSMLGSAGFYPAAWHAAVSMIVLGTGVEIPIAANAFTVVIGAIWVLGVAWLTETVTGSRRIGAYAAILSSGLQLFPLLMFQWGVLFPNALSVALVPASVAAAIWALQGLRDRRDAGAIARTVLLVGIGIAALALAQPASLPIWGLVLALWFTSWMLRDAEAPRRGWRIASVIGVWGALVLAWTVLSRGTGGSHWPPFRGKLEIFLDILFNGQMRIPFAWGLSALMLIGLVVLCLTRGRRWFVAAWLALSALYVLVAAIGMPLLRDGLLAPWYADPNRIAAYAPMVIIPLAAVGLDRTITFIVGRLRGDTRRMLGWVGAATATALMILIIALRPVPMPAFIEGTYDKDSRYLTTDESYLSVDERALLEALPDYVGDGARVIGNPSTGTGFGYMLSGVDVFPRTWSPPRSAAWETVAEDLRDASDDPAVCAALEALGDPAYVLDFGDGDNTPGRFEMPGMTGFEGREGFELVAERGTAELWRITACD